MYKEYRFFDPEKAMQKKQQLKQTYGYNFDVYKIQNPTGKEFLSIVHPVGLQPNPKRRH
jgi:IMP dehydrogenase/GMP reductase